MEMVARQGPAASCTSGAYAAPWWLRGGHAQTIAAALYADRGSKGLPVAARERWRTPDDDFIDVDRWPGGAAQTPLLVLFHGLEGSSRSHYARAMTRVAVDRGLAVAIPHFRGCSGELNRTPRAYHSGDHTEIDWMLRRFKAEAPGRAVMAMGVSLGGNALALWAARQGAAASEVVCACATMSAPLDLGAAGRAIDQGLNRVLYARMFLRSMVPKAQAKWQQHPGLFDLAAVRRASTLYAFDNAFTAPLHGFPDTQTYWTQAAARPHLARLRVPTLLLNARNDPFVPADSLPAPNEVSPTVTLWQPDQGGHAGFPAWRSGRLQLQPMAAQVLEWLLRHVPKGASHG